MEGAMEGRRREGEIEDLDISSDEDSDGESLKITDSSDED